ncbi:uncharacterized protein [Spinacia oleracea]|uniref:Reverse transcriptase domain-containing protein n=1 Tax=Spinacia oleracea TaxID=3562 RepID=A0ABM3QRI7_SPIOL|nr:uncharacterized protein LOC130461790 [Spinacia oleracea]
MDLRKAYDTVEWGFIEEILSDLGFPSHFTHLVMTCLTTTQYSILINGVPTPLLHPKRGLRQGDPLSPFLFTLSMKYFSRAINTVASHPPFRFHPRCKLLHLNHLCFADYLLMFCKGDPKVVQLMFEGFATFSSSTGLQYLGVPISPWKLKGSECDIMIDKMVARIKKINAICRSFMWFGNFDDSRPGSVARDKVCNPKACGTMGFRKIVLWNQAATDWSQFIASNYASWVVSLVCMVKKKCSGKLQSSEWLNKSRYSIKEMYSDLSDSQPKVHWHNQVWNRISVPKHGFILWLYMLNRLNTKARLFRVGVCMDNLCAICGANEETILHLFYKCKFSTNCKTSII